MANSGILQTEQDLLMFSSLFHNSKGENVKPQETEIEKKIEFLESLTGKVRNRRSRRWLNDRLLMELVPPLNADEIRGLFAPPPWGDDVPLSPFCMTNVGEWDKFRNIDMDKQASIIESQEDSSGDRRSRLDADKVAVLTAWHRVDCRTRDALRRSFLSELINSYEERVRSFIKESQDGDVLVLQVQDPFHRLLLHGVCEFYNLLSTTFTQLEGPNSLKMTRICKKKQILVSPITKDEYTNLYTMLVYLKTPLQPSKLQLELGSYLPFYDCARHYKSSSYQPIYSNSSLCTDLNPVTRKIAIGELLIDKLALPIKKPGQFGRVSDFLFSCTDPNKYSRIYRGLAKGVKGLAALGRFNYSLPAQLSRAFSSPQIFAVCLPGSSKADGVALFNSPGPYYFSPGVDLSKSLIYTPLLQGPRGADTQIYYWYKSPDYYVGLTSIKVNEKVVPLNKTLLAIDDLGYGGTKISTSRPYTVLESSIFKALTDAFMQESALLNLTLIKPVEPFRVCYAVQNVKNTRVGPAVPTIDLVLQSNNVFWRIFGSNSMVRITTKDVDAWCLGVVEGGSSSKTSIVIGGHQIEDNLLQFDVQSSMLGFSSSLLFRSTNCANFDFNSTKN
ncbi:unnamed protein product [Fraxinus pennsylvanica]|uniref:Peptidase A1 domain-containing protein n=1 Tax=Fraxinus pennsylvanica TaxID=56036 RepID=A0AAD2ADJ1_9LAMI|nr:unnamed protein product [Fraxinus pennsylvanica]